MKFSVVTPCLNCERLITETIESVLEQTAFKDGTHNLEYIICDGGSTDGTLNIINKYKKYCRVISAPDKGMYDGLAKGLRIASGPIVSYINAGDFYQKSAFETVYEIFSSKKIDWLCGYSVVCNYKSAIISVTLPYKYRNTFIQKGFYGKFLPNIQQESVFWSGNLNKLIDFEKLASFKLAGDFYLWREFSKHASLHIVMALLSGFKRYPNQLSSNTEAYLKEMDSILTQKPSFLDQIISRIDFLIWHLGSAAINKRLNSKQIIRYHQTEDRTGYFQ